MRRTFPDFSVYLSGRFISLIGDQAYFVLLGWAATTVDGVTGAAIVLSLASLPRAALMLVGGAATDFFGPRNVMIATDVVRLVLLLGVAWLVAAGGVTLAALVAVGVLLGVCDAFFFPADGAMVPMLVTRDGVLRANGTYQVLQQLAMLLGGPLGGILIGLVGVAGGFTVDALTFAASIASLLVLRSIAGRADRPAAADEWRPGRDLLAGMSYVRKHAFLSRAILFAAVLDFAFAGPINVALPAIADAHDWGANGYGLCVGAAGLGALAGAVVLWRSSQVRYLGRLAALATLGQGVSISGLGLSSSVIGACIAAFAAGVCMPLIGGWLLTACQLVAAGPMLGRVMGALAFAGMGLVPVAYAMTGLAGTFTSASKWTVVMGTLEVVAAVAAMKSGPLGSFDRGACELGRVDVPQAAVEQ